MNEGNKWEWKRWGQKCGWKRCEKVKKISVGKKIDVNEKDGCSRQEDECG